VIPTCAGGNGCKVFARHSGNSHEPPRLLSNASYQNLSNRDSSNVSSSHTNWHGIPSRTSWNHAALSKLYGSKDATREAFAKGLIENGESWMEIVQSRNRTSHTYNEETANEIADAILSCYVPEFEKFVHRFTEFEKDE
jgi:hypothetical protein